MSQDLFGYVLALLVVILATAVAAYIVASSTSRLVRGLASLGLTEVPWWLLRAPHGRHVRPRRSLSPEPHLPRVAVGRAALVAPEPDPDFAAEVESFIATLANPPVPDLKVRAAELLAHEEHEQRGAVPERTDVGATDDWFPSAEAGAMHIPPVLARTAPDAEEARILAELAGIADSWREVPEWLTEFGHETDAWLQAAKVAPAVIERHQRWRQGVMDWPTGEWSRALAFSS